ncbi:hypothetical protein FAZ95_02830 [Trinickia violacea]|uniref:Uncharacterized protein n=1 Tax=Trinickia violacea TaxID=2571746 RepID=A0A4P8IHT0_9BURK|nr:hypothetical protein [Trinickia violacea]QCP48218.1 hypothetical protein FAZ95_02830 [Trinickia violacea]
MATFVVMLAVCLAIPFGGGAAQKAVQPHEAQAVAAEQTAPATTLAGAALPTASAEAGDSSTPAR